MGPTANADDRDGADADPGRHVVGVLGASGGLGSSTFAALLAAAAASAPPGGLLIDLDAMSGGIDVLLGVEAVAGARWSGVRYSGGRLAHDALRAGLPAWSGAPVLAADGTLPDAATVHAVISAAAGPGVLVLDLPRDPGALAEFATACDLVVLLSRSDVAGLTAARVAVDLLPEGRAGLVVRGGARSVLGEAADLLGVGALGWLPPLRGGAAHDAEPAVGSAGRTARRLAAAIVSGLLEPHASPGRAA